MKEWNGDTTTCRICIDKMDGNMCRAKDARECIYSLCNEIEHLQAELAALKALHVTDLALAMKKVCEAAKVLLPTPLEIAIIHPQSVERELLNNLQQALEEWHEVQRKGEK